MRRFPVWLAAGPVVLGLVLGWAPGPASAAFPERDITVVVPWAAGGGTDTLARTLAKNSKKYFGVNMTVVNRVGGVGVIAMNSVATSKPDGYTVGLVTDYLSLYTMLGISELSYRDFDLVALLNRSPAGISVRMDSPYKTLKDMLDYAKANPGVLTAGHAGPGQAWHLAMASLALKYGLKFAYVPFDGSAPVRTALVGGHVSVATTGIDEVLQFYQAKQLRILGVNSLTRVSAFPDVPTFAEAGFPLENPIYAWRGLAVAKGTPPDVLKVLRDGFRQAAEDPEYIKLMETLALPRTYAEYDKFGEFLAATEKTLGPVLDSVGLLKKK
jgi:tripartite-type tricarboxylate transporter receptor subunit TctC